MGFLLPLLGPVGALASPINEGQETHCGDPRIAEFFDIAQALGVKIQNTPDSVFPMDGFKAIYSQKLREVVVTVEEQVFYEGKEYTAINFPKMNPPQIVISRSLWQYSVKEHAKYELLVLHELLPVLGLIDDGFVYSIELQKDINAFQTMNISKLVETYAVQSQKGAKIAFDYVSGPFSMDIKNATKPFATLSKKLVTLPAGEWSRDLLFLGLELLENVDPNIHRANLNLACAGKELEQSRNPDAKTLVTALKRWGMSSFQYCPL